MSRFTQQEKPVFAFKRVVHGDQGQMVYADDDVEKMIADIQQLY